MALRFLISVARPCTAVPANLAIPPGFAPVWSTPAIDVYVNDESLTLTEAEKAPNVLIIGHLFSRRYDMARIFRITPDLSQAIVKTEATNLIRDYWGGYLSIWVDGDEVVHILRDPSGTLPCLYVETDTHVFLASDVDALFDAGVLDPAIAWDHLASHLLFYELRSEHTALDGVVELLPSVRLTIAPRGVSKMALWSPWDHVHPQDLTPEDLREIVENTVGAWGRAFNRVALGVSGGLDSSIVAACLAEKGAGLTCFTLATEDPEGDERPYARQLTTALGVSLAERFYALGDVDVTRTSARHLARPILFAFGQSAFKARLDLAADYQIDAFFTGIGGDNIFCSLYSPTALIDRLRSEGLSGGLLSTLMDVSELSQATIWEVLGAAFKMAIKGHITPWHSETLMLAPKLVVSRGLDLSHPWLRPPDGVLPGKATHVSMFQRIQGTIDGFDRQCLGPQINPLLAQPIVEACLSIPSWAWCTGGENRSFARQAFEARLPHAIVHRRSKGGPGTFAHLVAETNRDAMRDLLLGGMLAEQGFLDEAAIAASLANHRPFDAHLYWRLSELAETEAWVRYWTNRPLPPRLP